ncbi:MAG: flagellar assembly protein FliW [Marmoricola sp.]|jgi:flagellar assembly factor FliW|nr:flagellar assembly protein FliW [Marmoricola sp.]
MITEYAPPAHARTGSTMTEIPLIELVQPMPGFPDLRQFALVQLDDDGVLCAFRSVEAPELRFLVVPPATFFPDYTPEVDEEAVRELGVGALEDILVLVVVKAGASLAESTANLAAPLLINASTRRARQVVLDDPAYSLAVPLVAA